MPYKLIKADNQTEFNLALKQADVVAMCNDPQINFETGAVPEGQIFEVILRNDMGGETVMPDLLKPGSVVLFRYRRVESTSDQTDLGGVDVLS